MKNIKQIKQILGQLESLTNKKVRLKENINDSNIVQIIQKQVRSENFKTYLKPGINNLYKLQNGRYAIAGMGQDIIFDETGQFKATVNPGEGAFGGGSKRIGEISSVLKEAPDYSKEHRIATEQRFEKVLKAEIDKLGIQDENQYDFIYDTITYYTGPERIKNTVERIQRQVARLNKQWNNYNEESD